MGPAEHLSTPILTANSHMGLPRINIWNNGIVTQHFTQKTKGFIESNGIMDDTKYGLLKHNSTGAVVNSILWGPDIYF